MDENSGDNDAGLRDPYDRSCSHRRNDFRKNYASCAFFRDFGRPTTTHRQVHRRFHSGIAGTFPAPLLEAHQTPASTRPPPRPVKVPKDSFRYGTATRVVAIGSR